MTGTASGPIDAAALGWDLPLPPEDRHTSPRTGWVRAHWEATADNLLLAVHRYRSPRGGLIDLPGAPARAGARSDGLEGFARTFLLAAIRASGEGGADPHGLLAGYVEGMDAGTEEPGGDGPDAWPQIGRAAGNGGQPMVESASVALGLHLARPWTWDALGDDGRDRVSAWLRRALRFEPAPNNWYLFPLTVASFLESVGRSDDETAGAISRGLSLLEGWYDGEGWYRDGDGRAFDHYGGWAMHLYPVLHAHLRGDDELRDLLGARLRRFLDDFAWLFDANGSPLYQGRSLTYRWAALGAVALGEVVGCSPLPPGQSRAIMSACVRHFLAHGAVAGGLLSRGWLGPHAATLQDYSGPASPYWASKGFLALLLPDDHPVWTATEEDPPVLAGDRAEPIAPACWLRHSTAGDGLVRVHNHGSDRLVPGVSEIGAADPLYGRLAYSTRTGPTSALNAADNDFSVVVRGARSARRRIHPLGTGPGWAASWFTPRFPDHMEEGNALTRGGPILPQARIDTLVLAHGAAELRVQRLHAVPDDLPARLTGWALAGAVPQRLPVTSDGTPAVTVTHLDTGLWTRLVGHHGWTGCGVLPAPQGTAFGAWARVPFLEGTTGPGLQVASATLTAQAAEVAPPEVDVDGTTVHVDWGDTTHVITWADHVPTVTHPDPGIHV